MHNYPKNVVFEKIQKIFFGDYGRIYSLFKFENFAFVALQNFYLYACCIKSFLFRMSSLSNTSNSINPYAHLNLNEEENRVAAIIFLFVILAGVIPYFPVLIVFIKNHHFHRHISYQIMIHIGVMDLFVQSGYLAMSIMMLTNDYFGHVFARV
jgi:hypothetical protein